MFDPSPKRLVAEAAPAEIRPVVFVTPPIGDEPATWLARRLGLDAWGDHLLTRRARAEMDAAAWVLLVVVLFEFLAWTLLFNAIVTGDVDRVTWSSIVAPLAAALFAGGVFLYERSFLTSDPSTPRWRKARGILLRLFVIVASALATSQPIEVLVFDREIDTRLKEAKVLDVAARLMAERAALATAEATGPMTAPSGSSASDATEARLALPDELVSWAAATLEAEARYTEAKSLAERAEDSLVKLRSKVDGAENDEERRNLQVQLTDVETSARLRRDAAKAAHRAWKAAEVQAQAARDTYRDVRRADEDAAIQRMEAEAAHREAVAADLRADDDLVALLLGAEPGRPVTSEGQLIDPYAVGFVARLQVLGGLIAGRPVRCPAAPAVCTEAATRFRIADPASTDSLTAAASTAALYRYIWGVTLGVSLVVPLITLAFKVILAQELAVYYNLRVQARAGNPEAIMLRRAMEPEAASELP